MKYLDLRDKYIQRRIILRLNDIEQKHNVKIIFACEAGSRAWGFASPNSDYDVRFIYVRPVDYYLSINVENKSDTLQMLDKECNLDIDGWDLRKALKLFRKCNPSLLEWLNSPIVYNENDLVISQMRLAKLDFFNEIACQYHYFHMAMNNYYKYIVEPTTISTKTKVDSRMIKATPRKEISYKKYLYVLRPLLAMDWIGEGKGDPPVRFDKLVYDQLPTRLLAPLGTLLKLKMSNDKKIKGPPIPEIQDYLDSKFESYRLGESKIYFDGEIKSGGLDTLNSMFRSAIKRMEIKKTMKKLNDLEWIKKLVIEQQKICKFTGETDGQYNMSTVVPTTYLPDCWNIIADLIIEINQYRIKDKLCNKM